MSPALHSEPSSADAENKTRDGMMSARLSSATNEVPATNPSCTAVVSQPTCEPLSDQRTCNCGAMALPANHSDIPSSSATARSASMRQRTGCVSDAPLSGCGSLTVATLSATLVSYRTPSPV